MKKEKRNKKIKWKNIFILLILILCLVTLIVSIINIINWKKDSMKTNTQIDKILEITDIKEEEDSENVEIINDENKDKEDPYWDYIKTNLINVDFSELKRINSSTVGWIQVNGTIVNYPFVQTTNNEYYLVHSFDKTYNEAGWVFLDYRNNINNLDKNTIIYAHGREDNTMFGSLKNILQSNWVKDKDNFIIKLSTEAENTLWQVFSVYRTPTTNDYLSIKFNFDEEFYNFANMLLERSKFNFNTSINSNDKILTLSTCYDLKDKVVLHAKLIKREKR